MSSATPSTFLRQPAASPFCPACGYRPYVEQLDRALIALQLDPSKVAIVSDIGCIGAVEDVVATPHLMCAMHGQSTAVATGIELADAILHDSALKTIVIVGDGGAAVGLQHILNAAAMNLDVTVLVANNWILGLSGGQASSLCAAPRSGATPGTCPRLDLCALAQQCGGGFIARIAATDEGAADTIAQAIAHPGFALVEVLVDCVAYGQAVPRAEGRERLPAQVASAARPDFGLAYKQQMQDAPAPDADTPLPIVPCAPVRRNVRWVVAGSAGEQVPWAARVLAEAAAMTGSHVTQNNMTGPLPGTGIALSEVCVSREPIGYVGIDRPDVVIAVSQDALDELAANGTLARATDECLLVLDDSLPLVDTDAETLRAPLRARCTPARAAMVAVLLANKRRRSIAERAMFAAIRRAQPRESSRYRNDLSELVSLMG